MRYISKISASHYVIPKKTLTNDELGERFGAKKVEGISKLSGIFARRVADKDTTAADLGAEAARRMIEAKKIDKNSIDLLVFITSAPDYVLPPSASIIHERLGLPQTCGSFDMTMGCPAFPYGISVCGGMIASGQCRKILLVIADTVTKLVNPLDRGLATLHGDGAAAFILEPSDGDEGVVFSELGTDSSGWRYLLVPAGGFKTPRSPETSKLKTDESGSSYTDENLQMNGPAVFHFSISKIPAEIKRALEKHSLKVSDADLVLLHQANKMMIESICKALDVPPEKRFFFMEDVGNLGAASTPVLLAEGLRSGRAAAGSKILISSFGVGLSWGTCLIKIGDPAAIAADADTQY